MINQFLFLKSKFRVFIPAITCSVLLLLLFVLFYDKDNAIMAQERAVQCEPQIPIGEALDRNGEFIIELTANLRTIQGYIPYQIEAAEEMINGADQCDTSPSTCRPIDCGSYDCTPQVPCADPLDPGPCWGASVNCCNAPSACGSPWGGRACPQADIETSFQKVSTAYENILRSKKEIISLINGIDEDFDRRVPLCAKENEDIRTGFDNFTCLDPACQVNPSSINCPQITKLDVIERKLAEAREDFEACSVSQTEFLQMSRGEIPVRSPASCATVLQNDYERKQPDCRCAPDMPLLPPECGGFDKKSLLNYYCCR